MKNTSSQHVPSRGTQGRSNEKTRSETGYIYLVRNPSSNETSVCASRTALKRGAKVIAPTRYGLDYAVVVGSASSLAPYEPGSLEPQGACLRILSVGEPFDPDEDLVAAADYDGPPLETPVLEAQPAIVEQIDVHNDCSGCPGCAKAPMEDSLVEIDGDIEWIERLASEDDERRVREYAQMEEEALRLCREKILRHGLDMKLVTAHYLFGEPKIIFFFTAANRVDFRDLVKDLVSVFRIRIELRQIGVRDESRVLGGLAVCGRDFCCHCVTDKLNPVSIKMAKEQNLSLNSTKISGPCGRLLCCLSYEYDFYYEEKQKLPPEGSKLKVRQDLMKVSEVNLLSRKILLTAPEGRYLTIPFDAVVYNDETSRWEIDKDYLEDILSV